jgi:uncharacterized membrane protein YfcA
VVTISPGRPFWSAVAAFASSMVGLIGMDNLAITQQDVQVTWLGAFLVSLFVAVGAYAGGKLASLRKPKPSS